MPEGAADDAELLAEIVDQLPPVCLMTALRDADDTIVDFRYQLVNPAFCRAVNEPAKVLLGARLLELYPSHVELGLFAAYCRVVETGEPFVSELPWFDERHVRGFLEVRVTKFHDGYLMTGRDITAEKMGDQALDIFDSSHDGIISVDVGHRITAWNRGAERLYGFSSEEAIGQHLSICSPEELRSEQSEFIASVLRNELGSEPLVTTRRHRDGTLRQVEISAAPIRDGDSRIVGGALIHRELADRDARSRNARTDHAPPQRGQAVEVWSSYSKAWVPGFWFDRTQPDGSALVRRGSDRTPIPTPIPADSVRPVQQPRPPQQ